MNTTTFELACPACGGPANAVATSPTAPYRWVCLACKVLGFLPPILPYLVPVPLAFVRPAASA